MTHRGVKCLFLALLMSCVSITFGSICVNPICKYSFIIRRARTMTYVDKSQRFVSDIVHNTYSVLLNGTRLQVQGNEFRRGAEHDIIGRYVSSSDVITADGYERDIITINDEFPGPNIEVMEDAQVEVRVENHLWTEAVSLHWHGISQWYNVWMDGVPNLTQCPIQPKQTFIYRFKAEPAGTHWYHSHIANQRLDGLFGMLIVHKKLPKMTNFALTVMDWYHETATEMHVLNPYDMQRPGTGDMHRFPVDFRDYSQDNVELSAFGYQSGLINGRGRVDHRPFPITNFTLEPGKSHRFRIAHTGAEFTFEVSIDDHMLDVVASDGQDIVPVLVDYLIIFPGETYDLEVKANQAPGLYWLRAATIREGSGPNPKSDGTFREVLASISYKGSDTGLDPISKRKVCTSERQCTVFNCPFKKYSVNHHRNCISLDEVESKNKTEQFRSMFGLDDEEIHEYFFNMAFSIGSSVNGKKFIGPSEPFYQNKTRSIIPCDATACRSGCQCTNIQKLPFNKTVQIVFTGIQPDFEFVAHHSIHVHGHNFAVLKIGYPDFNQTTGKWLRPNNDVWCESTLCHNPRWSQHPPDINLHNPPVKDTVMLPARGYVVVRFRTDNPGYWRVHCHQELHLMEGMDMILDEGPGYHPPLPANFPTCTSFEWSEKDFNDYHKQAINNKAKDKGKDSNGDVKPLFASGGYTMQIRLGTTFIVGASLIIATCLLACCILPWVIFFYCCRGCHQSKYYPVPETDDYFDFAEDPKGSPALFSSSKYSASNIRRRRTKQQRRLRNMTM